MWKRTFVSSNLFDACSLLSPFSIHWCNSLTNAILFLSRLLFAHYASCRPYRSPAPFSGYRQATLSFSLSTTRQQRHPSPEVPSLSLSLTISLSLLNPLLTSSLYHDWIVRETSIMPQFFETFSFVLSGRNFYADTII